MVSARGEGFLHVGNDLAVYREQQPIDLASDSTFRLQHVPRMADLSTFSVELRRYPLVLNTWTRQLPQPAPVEELVCQGDDIVWHPHIKNAASSAPDDTVAVKVRMAPAGRRPVLLSYAMKGWKWSARYTAVLRGQSEVSTDLTGIVQIYNPTPMTFEDVRLTLESGGVAEPGTPTAPGFLMLPEYSPMADLFADTIPSLRPVWEYMLPNRVTLFGYEENQLPFLQARRLRGEQVFQVDSQAFPLSGSTTLKPTRSVLLIPNDAPHNMGWTLPAGPVEVYEGSTLTPPVFVGQMAHSESGSKIVLDLGLSEKVVARRSRTASWLEAGSQKDRYAIELLNQSDRNVQVELLEYPEIEQKWNLISSSEPAEETAHRLKFTLNLEKASRTTVEYVISSDLIK